MLREYDKYVEHVTEQSDEEEEEEEEEFINSLQTTCCKIR